MNNIRTLMTIEIQGLFVLQYLLTAPQKNSIKFNSQWNFGRKMHMWPAFSMVSWTSDLCSRKSGCNDMRRVAQQVVASGMHEFFGHLRRRPPLGHKPRSSKIICIPFGCGDPESVLGITMECETFSPPRINQPFRMQGFFPPGPRFIRWTRRASAGYAECPWELSTMKSAWYSGPWAFSNAGIIFSFNLEQHFQFLCL
jgi:hypothetical protein